MKQFVTLTGSTYGNTVAVDVDRIWVVVNDVDRGGCEVWLGSPDSRDSLRVKESVATVLKRIRKVL